MSKKLMLIINPVSGRGQIRYAFFDILSIFSEHDYIVSVFMTQKSGDAERFAAAYAADFDLVVCVGGDGTLSEVINGLMCIPSRPPIGYIPMGTANDIATTLKLSKNPRKAAKAIVTGRPFPLDVGKFEDFYFAYIMAFGAFTEVAYSTPQGSKKTLGNFAYILEAMFSLPRITSYHAIITYDDGIIEGDFVFGAVTNSTSVAGFVKINPVDVGLNDGYFEVILIKSPQNITEMNRIVSSVLTRNFESEHVVFLHTKKIGLSFSNAVAWTRDGESGGTFRTIDAENCSQAVSIIF